MSTTPAFSPMPTIRFLVISGLTFWPNWRSQTFELLYEQCSLHITEYMASSPLVGRRPRMSRMRWYSSLLRPSAAYGCSFSGVAIACETESRGALIASDSTERVSAGVRQHDDGHHERGDHHQQRDGERDSGAAAEVDGPAQAESPGDHQRRVVAVDVEQAALPV